jgi:hypothetical protein
MMKARKEKGAAELSSRTDDDRRRNRPYASNVSASFPFAESPDVGVWTTRAIADGAQPILLVSHHADGDWQFLPGSILDMQDGVVLHLHHIVDRYPEIHELADLPRGWAAERDSVGDPWRRWPLDDDG